MMHSMMQLELLRMDLIMELFHQNIFLLFKHLKMLLENNYHLELGILHSQIIPWSLGEVVQMFFL
jgi:hypothetical protein